ncbi:MAG: TetR/AcrR family transcriptional regulator [Spongiibacteraceae bacterium]
MPSHTASADLVTGRPRRRQHERSAESDRRIVSAAIQALNERGINELKISDVAQRAGYSQPLIVQRYGGKAGLLARVSAVITENWQDVYERVVGNLSGLPALCASVDAHSEFIAERPKEVRAIYLLHMLALDASDEYPATVQTVTQTHRPGARAKTWIAAGMKDGSIRSDINAKIEAEMFAALIIGLVYSWMANPKLPIRTLHARVKEELIEHLESQSAKMARQRANKKRKNAQA